jgi:hypothetical protein
MDEDLFDDPLLRALRDARPREQELSNAGPLAEQLLAEILARPTGNLQPNDHSVRLHATHRLPLGWARQTPRVLIVLAVAAVLVLVLLIPLERSPHATVPSPAARVPAPALARSLLVAPVWYSSCCTLYLPEKSPLELTVIDAGTGHRSTITPFSTTLDIELPWVAVGPYVVALARPPRASIGGSYEAYAFEPGTPRLTTLGKTTGVLAATSGNAVWLENLRPGAGVCFTVREVTVAGEALTGTVALPCQASIVEAVSGGLLLELPLTGSGPSAVRLELWNPSTGKVVWYRDESSYPAELGPRYMVYPAGTCVPGEFSEVSTTDLVTGHTIDVHLAVPLPAHSGRVDNSAPYESVTTFSPTVPQDLAVLTGDGYAGKTKSLERAGLDILDVLTGRVIYERQLTLVTEPVSCSTGPCQAPSSNYGGSNSLYGNPPDPYVSWSWGGGFLLIGRGGSEVIAYRVGSETAPGAVIDASPDSLVVEKP